PAEVSFHMHAQEQQQLRPVGFAPMPMTAGYAMPVGGQMMPMGGQMQMMGAAGYAPPQVGMVAQPTVQYGQVTYATQVPVSQVPPPPAPPAAAPVGAAPPAKSAADLLLEDCQRKLEE